MAKKQERPLRAVKSKAAILFQLHTNRQGEDVWNLEYPLGEAGTNSHTKTIHNEELGVEWGLKMSRRLLKGRERVTARCCDGTEHSIPHKLT